MTGDMTRYESLLRAPYTEKGLRFAVTRGTALAAVAAQLRRQA